MRLNAEETKEVLDRTRRIESRLVNLSDYLGCSLVDRHKRESLEKVHVVGHTINVLTPAATFGDLTLAIHESGEEGEFAVHLAGRYWGHVKYTRTEETTS